jgi:hypothetical protein
MLLMLRCTGGGLVVWGNIVVAAKSRENSLSLYESDKGGAPSTTRSVRVMLACSKAWMLTLWLLLAGCSPERLGNATLSTNGSGPKSDGVFMAIGENLAQENLTLMRDAGFGVIFFLLGDADGVRWEELSFIAPEWSREEVLSLLQPARTMGFKVVPWIQNIWLANTATSVVVSHLKTDGLPEQQIAQPSCQVEEGGVPLLSKHR